MALLSILLLIFSTTILSYETASLPEARIVDDVTVPELECSGSNTVAYPATITSPNYPGWYTDNLDSSFTLIPRPGQAVYLDFDDFEVSWANTCKDYVEINPPIGGVSRYCGNFLSNAPPTTTFVVDQLVTVRFVTDGSWHGYRGWSATFNIV